MTEESPLVSDAAVNPAGPPEPAKAKRGETEYHVLQLRTSVGAAESYSVEARNVAAASAKDAIKKSVMPTTEPVSYIAVPSKSFKLYPVSKKVIEQTVIG